MSVIPTKATLPHFLYFHFLSTLSLEYWLPTLHHICKNGTKLYLKWHDREKKKKKKQVHDDQGETFDSCFVTCDYFSVVDTTTATGRDPKDVARAVVKAVRHKSKDVVLAGLLPTAAIYLRTLWPALFFKLMSSRARKEQKAKNTWAKTKSIVAIFQTSF